MSPPNESHTRAGRRDLAALLRVPREDRAGLSYTIRVLAATLLTFLLCEGLRVASPTWAIVSAVVVILPGHQASVASATLRVIANIVGAGVGAAVAALHLSTLPALALGIVAVIALCRALGLDAAARTASVSLVIVLLKDPFGVLTSSEARVAQVLLGCAVALIVTVLAAVVEKRTTGGEAASDSE